MDSPLIRNMYCQGLLPVIPVGAGIKWMVTPCIAVNAEATLRISFSDYIDGFFSYAANPKRKDAYYDCRWE